jgi:uncharacterized small protein (DUF1192 family)
MMVFKGFSWPIIARLLTGSAPRGQHRSMDDEFSAFRPDSPLTLVTKEDIDRLSVDELDARVAALEAEIDRTKARRQFAINHKSSADALFKR